MSTLHKLKTLLTDLRDKALRRQWHVRCLHCTWEVHNLEHARFAKARGKMHNTNEHQTPHLSSRIAVWHSRA